MYNHFGFSPGGLWVKEIYYIPASSIEAKDLDNFLSLCWRAPQLFGDVKQVRLLSDEEWDILIGRKKVKDIILEKPPENTSFLVKIYNYIMSYF